MEANRNEVIAQLQNTIKVNIEKAISKQSVKGFVITDITLNYVMVQVGNGLNGSNVSLDLLNPFVFGEIQTATKYSNDVYAENGKGKIEWQVMEAKEFFSKVQKQNEDMLQTISGL